ncbi:MAG: hypothetical protein JWP66_1933 [Naasia sp.]|nr:hypothetical protein [Naasia sp.]
MRLYLKDSERRPDPEPVRTDDRKAILTGLVLWVLALVAVLLATSLGGGRLDDTPVWACTGGIAVGLVLLVYAERRRRRG